MDLSKGIGMQEAANPPIFLWQSRDSPHGTSTACCVALGDENHIIVVVVFVPIGSLSRFLQGKGAGGKGR